MSNYRLLRLKQIQSDRINREKNKPAHDYRHIAVRSVADMTALRELGWREASVNQAFNDKLRTRLAWFVYPNGMRRINILTHSLKRS